MKTWTGEEVGIASGDELLVALNELEAQHARDEATIAELREKLADVCEATGEEPLKAIADHAKRIAALEHDMPDRNGVKAVIAANEKHHEDLDAKCVMRFNELDKRIAALEQSIAVLNDLRNKDAEVNNAAIDRIKTLEQRFNEAVVRIAALEKHSEEVLSWQESHDSEEAMPPVPEKPQELEHLLSRCAKVLAAISGEGRLYDRAREILSDIKKVAPEKPQEPASEERKALFQNVLLPRARFEDYGVKLNSLAAKVDALREDVKQCYLEITRMRCYDVGALEFKLDALAEKVVVVSQNVTHFASVFEMWADTGKLLNHGYAPGDDPRVATKSDVAALAAKVEEHERSEVRRHKSLMEGMEGRTFPVPPAEKKDTPAKEVKP